MKQNKTVHLSVDDTIWLFWDLTENNYKSAFEQPVLKFFKELNKKYGFTVTFYCIMEREWLSLRNITDRYKDNFEQNNQWCKFGFHAYNEQRRYATDAYKSVKDDYSMVVCELQRIVGNSIDHSCRIHCYSMKKSTLKSFRKSGLEAILAPEEGAEFNLGLSQREMMKIKQSGIYRDVFDRTIYIETEYFDYDKWMRKNYPIYQDNISSVFCFVNVPRILGIYSMYMKRPLYDYEKKIIIDNFTSDGNEVNVPPYFPIINI